MRKILLVLLPVLLVASVDIKIEDGFAYQKGVKTYNASFKMGKKVVNLKGLGTFTKEKTSDKLKIDWVYTKYRNKNIDLRENKLMSNLELDKNERVKKGINVSLNNKDDISTLKLYQAIEKSYKEDKEQISFEKIKEEYEDKEDYANSKKLKEAKDKKAKTLNPHKSFQDGKYSTSSGSKSSGTDLGVGIATGSDDSVSDDDTATNLTDFDCQPKVIGDSVQFYQIQNDACVAMATPVAINENPDVCENKLFYDDKNIEIYSRREAQPSYSGNIFIVESCRLLKTLPIQSTTKDITDGIDNTGILADLAKMKAIQYQKWYYTQDGVRVFVGEAVPTSTTYELKTTTVGCEEEIAKAKGVYSQDEDKASKLSEEYYLNYNRIVFEDNFNIVREVRGCEPLGIDNFIKVITEPVKDTNGIIQYSQYPELGFARLKVRKYYIHPSTGEKMYLSSKAITDDMENTFYYNVEACIDEDSKVLANAKVGVGNKGYKNGWYHDDELKTSTYVTAKFFIDNVNFDNSKVYVGGSKICDKEASNVVIPYVDVTNDEENNESLNVDNAKGDKRTWETDDIITNKIIYKQDEKKYYYNGIIISELNGLKPGWKRILSSRNVGFDSVKTRTTHKLSPSGFFMCSSNPSTVLSTAESEQAYPSCLSSEVKSSEIWKKTYGAETRISAQSCEYCWEYQGDTFSPGCSNASYGNVYKTPFVFEGFCNTLADGYLEDLKYFTKSEKWLRADGSLKIEKSKKFYKLVK